jgi:hypothetical protein
MYFRPEVIKYKGFHFIPNWSCNWAKEVKYDIRQFSTHMHLHITFKQKAKLFPRNGALNVDIKEATGTNVYCKWSKHYIH